MISWRLSCNIFEDGASNHMNIEPDKDFPFVARYKPEVNPVVAPLNPGDLCPKCQEGRMDYDGLLNLACSKCGYALSEAAGCT